MDIKVVGPPKVPPTFMSIDHYFFWLLLNLPGSEITQREWVRQTRSVRDLGPPNTMSGDVIMLPLLTPSYPGEVTRPVVQGRNIALQWSMERMHFKKNWSVAAEKKTPYLFKAGTDFLEDFFKEIIKNFCSEFSFNVELFLFKDHNKNSKFEFLSISDSSETFCLFTIQGWQAAKFLMQQKFIGKKLRFQSLCCDLKRTFFPNAYRYRDE